MSLWWLALHALLAVAALLVGWSWFAKTVAIVAVLGHAVWRWPAPPPGVIEVGADGACSIPGSGFPPLALGTRTCLSPFWLHIVAGSGPETLDILLLIDQLDADDWRRCRAILRRATVR